MSKKIKVLVISDHPFSPSGVGTQTRYMIEGMLQTGKFKFLCLAGAIKHQDYNAQKTEQWGDDLIMYPVDGYGSQDMIRSLIRTERPDMLWFMTDPRFYAWLWEIEDEIRSLIPMVYYHVWDNYPYPRFNKVWYDSCDHVACISKVTYDIVQNVSPDVQCEYLPHAVNPTFFRPLPEEQIESFKKQRGLDDKFVVFWNNRNAKRKQPGTLIHVFKQFLDKVGHDKACLVMHTEPKDPNGPDLIANIADLGLTNGEVRFSTQKVEFHDLAVMYNMSDVTVNVSDAEGFGLATLESLSCETPIIVNMTGGLQEQVTDGENWFGVGLKCKAKPVIGSQNVPYIYEDHFNNEDLLNALLKMYEMSPEERKALGAAGADHVKNNYSFDKYIERWEKCLLNIHENLGSWETRKNYKTWQLLEVK